MTLRSPAPSKRPPALSAAALIVRNVLASRTRVEDLVMAATNGPGVRVGDIVPASWLPGSHFVVDASKRFAVGDFVIVTRADKRLGVGGVVRVPLPSHPNPVSRVRNSSQLLATPIPLSLLFVVAGAIPRGLRRHDFPRVEGLPGARHQVQKTLLLEGRIDPAECFRFTACPHDSESYGRVIKYRKTYPRPRKGRVEPAERFRSTAWSRRARID